MSKPLPEETKTRISELYKTSDQSMGVIAQALGVSERTVRRYKDYDGLGRPRPDNNGKAWPDLDRPSPVASPHGQALEKPGRPSQNETDQALDITERPSPDSEYDDEEEPKRINFVGGTPYKAVEPEKEEFDWECPDCGHEFNGDLPNCPECGVEFDLEGNSEKKGSIDLGKIALALGGLVTVGYLIHRARNNNQSFPDTS